MSPVLPGIRPAKPGEGPTSIPFSKAAPKDHKQELRKYYGEAGQVIHRAKASTVELHTLMRDTKERERVNVLKDTAQYRSEREMNLMHFAELMQIFKTASIDGTGKINYPQFKQAFSTVLGSGLTDTQMSLLFMKVDANMDGTVDWEEFSTFMLLRAEGQYIMEEQAGMQLFDELGMRVISSPHKDMIIRVISLEKSGKYLYLTCGRDGTICFWSDGWKVQRCFPNVGQPHNIPGTKLSMPWTHDCIYLPNLNKLALSSDNHEITFYDAATMDPQLRIDLHDTVAFSLAYYYDESNPDSDISTLFFGTDSGYTVAVTFTHNSLFSPLPKNSAVPPTFTVEVLSKIPGVIVHKKHSHKDWVGRIEYYHDLRSVVSCSGNERDSLVIATQLEGGKKWEILTANVRKGVNAFAYSKFPLALVTGGTDRQLRIWNPRRLNRPTASLSGHASPVISLTINPLSGQIISLSTDKNIKIWDIRKAACIQTIASHMDHRPENYLSSICFNPQTGKLIAVSSAVVVYGLVDKEIVAKSGGVRSHEFPVRAALYNAVFGQVVSGCDGGVVNVWDTHTGQKTFRFTDAHGKAEITAMAFDGACRRLITGGRDGGVRIWNFNNGQLLQELEKGDVSEVTGILYIVLKECGYIVITGWNRLIQLFPLTSSSSVLRPTHTLPVAHSDDVLTMAFCPPDLLATASCDGEIVVSCLRNGSVVGRLRVDEDMTRKVSVDKVLFLHQRTHIAATPSLISSGSDGIIRWWNIQEMYLMYEQDAGRQEGVFSMCANNANTILISGDAGGWISVWDIAETCMSQGHNGMKLLKAFKAHVRSVISLDLTEDNIIVSASTDCTVRMWTLSGAFVGTFGQPVPWDLANPSTYAIAKPPELLRFKAEKAEQEKTEKEVTEDYSESGNGVDEEETVGDILGLDRARNRISRPPTRKLKTPSRSTTSLKDETSATPSTPTYRSWYARSDFAKHKLTHRRRPHLLPPLRHGKTSFPGAGGIFHHLEPYELGDISIPRLTTAQSKRRERTTRGTRGQL